MSDIAIKVEGLSKQYRLGEVGTGTISHDLNRWWARMRGKEDPFLKLGEANDRTQVGNSDYVWALRDINFEVKQGEVLGIIGRNGAGKSTLLKILSKTTKPTAGVVKVKGRIASLLEVGTGFHPEMTGRENIFLNGAILGMTRREIKSKFDEIVDFAGVERYVDTPVKRYSSGMYVRLAFAVAAHLEPEILIVDEVLAVGDAEFQKKCLGKMKDVSVNDGRTILFVSHNMLAVKSLCNSGLLIESGTNKANGPIEKVIDLYFQKNNAKKASNLLIQKEQFDFVVHSIDISNNGLEGCFNIEEDLIINIVVEAKKSFEEININIFFNSQDGGLIFATCSNPEKCAIGIYTYSCTIPAFTLNDNNYILDLMVVKKGPVILHDLKEIITIEGYEEKREGSWLAKFPGLIRPAYFKWEKKNSND